MRSCILFLMLGLSSPLYSQSQPQATLKSVLLEQIQLVHKQKDWFAPANVAVSDLTAEQAAWTAGKGNHSIGQLVSHLVFWNRDSLLKFKGEKSVGIGSNDETFNRFDAKQWQVLVKDFDKGLADWEQAIQAADEKKLQQWASWVGRLYTHNAYHIGQIIYIRKLQGSWDPEKGVK